MLPFRWHVYAYWDRLMCKLNRLLCRLFGHKKPYEQHLCEDICPRCFIVLRQRSPYLRFPP